jgi:hypothetical protein
MFTGPADHRTPAVACSKHERRFENGWEHDDAFGLLEYRLRNVLRDIHDFLHYFTGSLQSPLGLVVGTTNGRREQCHSHQEN